LVGVRGWGQSLDGVEATGEKGVEVVQIVQSRGLSVVGVKVRVRVILMVETGLQFTLESWV